MPSYEFKCKSCGAVVVVVQGFTDTFVPECDKCEKPMQKNFNVGGVYIH